MCRRRTAAIFHISSCAPFPVLSLPLPHLISITCKGLDCQEKNPHRIAQRGKGGSLLRFGGKGAGRPAFDRHRGPTSNLLFTLGRGLDWQRH